MQQKHISPTLGQIQTKAALQNFKDFYAKPASVSFDEKVAQSERERRSLFRILATGVLKDLGFKVR
jgi:hypothetical protein